jgi:hypothetical protein
MDVYHITQGMLIHEFTFLPVRKVPTSYAESGLEDNDNNIGLMQCACNGY